MPTFLSIVLTPKNSLPRTSTNNFEPIVNFVSSEHSNRTLCYSSAKLRLRRTYYFSRVITRARARVHTMLALNKCERALSCIRQNAFVAGQLRWQRNRMLATRRDIRSEYNGRKTLGREEPRFPANPWPLSTFSPLIRWIIGLRTPRAARPIFCCQLVREARYTHPRFTPRNPIHDSFSPFVSHDAWRHLHNRLIFEPGIFRLCLQRPSRDEKCISKVFPARSRVANKWRSNVEQMWRSLSVILIYILQYVDKDKWREMIVLKASWPFQERV